MTIKLYASREINNEHQQQHYDAMQKEQLIAEDLIMLASRKAEKLNREFWEHVYRDCPELEGYNLTYNSKDHTLTPTSKKQDS